MGEQRSTRHVLKMSLSNDRKRIRLADIVVNVKDMEGVQPYQFWWKRSGEIKLTSIYSDTTSIMEKTLSNQVENNLQQVENGHTVLHFNYQGLSELPKQLFTDDKYSHIRRMHLKRNRLKTLPDTLGNLSNLTELYLHSNDLIQLPDSIGKLKQLESLDLSNNNLTSLPDSITDLENLSVLAVSNNQIQQLPKGLDKMKKLMVLDLMNNNLRFLPPEVIRCPRLQRLLLDRNHLTWLPKQLCRMTSLVELSVAGNELVTLPLDLGHIPTLRTVFVDNNRYLHALPLSLQNQEIGFNSCGTRNFDPIGDQQKAALSVSIKHDDGVKVIYLPSEILHMARKEDPVVTLLELATRQVYKHNLSLDDLPRNLQYSLCEPTASCAACQRHIFTSGFPLVFEGQIHLYSLYYVALCCSLKCMRLANVLIQLPVVYPEPEDLDQVLVLVN